MRSRFVILICIMMVARQGVMAQAGSVCPQDLLPEKNAKGLWGYTDLFGRWEIEPVFTATFPFAGNKAIVKKGGQIGVIGCDGYLLLQPIYDDISPLHTGRFWVAKAGKWSLVEVNGKILAANVYDEVKEAGLESTTTWVRRGDKWGLFNKVDNNYLLIPQFELMQLMSAKAALVKKDELFGVVDNVTGSFLVKPSFSTVKKINPGMVMYTENNLRGLMTEEGTVITPARYDTVAAMNRFVYKISKNFKYGMLDLNGRELLQAEYDSLGDFSELTAIVKKDGKYGYVSSNGRLLLSPTYAAAQTFKNGTAVVSSGNTRYLIDKKGTALTEPYTLLHRNEMRNYMAGGTEGSVRLLNQEGKKIGPEVFEKVFADDSGAFVRAVQNGKTGFYSADSARWTIKPTYDAAQPFAHNYAVVTIAGKQGAVNTSGKQVWPAEYESVEYELIGKTIYFKLKKNGKYGIGSGTGKIEIPCEYDTLVQAEGMHFKAKKGGKWGLIKLNNTPVAEFVYATMSHKINHPGAPDFPAMVSLKNKYALLAENGALLTKPEYENLAYAGESFYKAGKKGKKGIINSKGAQVIPFDFEELDLFSEKLIAYKSNGKWGYFLNNGTQRTPPVYEEAYPFLEYMAVVKENGKYGVIDPFGNYLIPARFDSYTFNSGNGERRLSNNGRVFVLEQNAYLRYVPTPAAGAFVTKTETLKNNPATGNVLLTGQAFYTDSKLPATGKTIVVKDEQGNVLQRTQTNEKGLFVFRQLPPNNYLLSFEPVAAELSISTQSFPEPQNLVNFTKEDFEKFNYRQLGKDETFVNISVSGQLTGDNRDESDRSLLLLDADNNVIDKTTVNKEGYFAFRKLKPGNYSMVTLAGGEKITPKVQMIYEDPHLSVHPGDLTKYDYKLLKEMPLLPGDRINITGMVSFQAGGKPAKDVALLLIDENGNVLRHAVSNPDGVFSFEYLPAAAYQVVMEIHNPEVKTEIQVFTDDSELTFGSVVPDEQLVGTIFYGVNEDEISSDGKKLLDKFALDYKSGTKIKRLHINTYGDASGTFEYNLKLTQRRGEKIKNYLVSKGISSHVIKINAYGKSLSPAGESKGYNPKLNRKADLKLTFNN